VTPLIVDRRTAAATLGVSIWTLDRFVAAGLLTPLALPSVKRRGSVSRRVLFAVSDLERFVDAQRERTRTP
jgi:hypothetical protein